MAAASGLTPEERAFLRDARRATLATIRADGRPRLVPVCHVVLAFALPDEPDRPVVYTPLDEKPKQVTDPRDLARVGDIRRRPEVTLLVDRWDEDWSRLAWLRCDGRAALLEPLGDAVAEHRVAVAALRAKYPQYDAHDLDGRPLIRIAIDRVRSWGALSDPGTALPPAGAGSGSSSSPGGSRRR
jgi:PPOX class probable F420-dependent enzyme